MLDMYGWMGKILEVELTKRKIDVRPLSESLVMGYLGGRGINMRIIWDLVGPKRIDPLSPENVQVIGAGPLTGTLSPSSGRFNISARRGTESITFGDSNAGGFWAPELKYAGYDHIVLHGASEKAVYLWITDNHAELRDASHLWGKTTSETDEILKEDHGDPEIHTACIGPAGENLVRYACVIADARRAAGRTGMGAVMGSKKLKAIAVRGTQGVRIAKPKQFEQAVKGVMKIYRASANLETFIKYGTPILPSYSNPGGHFTTRNSQTGAFEGAEKLMVDYVFPRYYLKDRGCFNCPIRCTKVFEIREEPFEGLRYDKLEYNTIYSFGSNVGNDYFPAILKASELCNDYGLHVDGTGFSIAWAMECFEKGLLTRKDTNGLDLTWGNYRAIHTLIPKIANREGFGNILAEGPKGAAEKVKRGTEKYAHSIKGMTLYGDMRARQGWGLAYCVSTRGPDHLRGAADTEFMGLQYSPEEVQKMLGEPPEKLPIKRGTLDPLSLEDKASTIVWFEHLCAIVDSAGMCKYMTGWYALELCKFRELAKLLSAVTGMDFDELLLKRIGERIYNLERAMNAVDGITRKDEVLPPRQYEPLPSGPKKGVRIDPKQLEKAKNDYYEWRGWNISTGLPTRRKLEELGLKDVADELEKIKILPTDQ